MTELERVKVYALTGPRVTIKSDLLLDLVRVAEINVGVYNVHDAEKRIAQVKKDLLRIRFFCVACLITGVLTSVHSMLIVL